jgi:hypothetical protein
MDMKGRRSMFKTGAPAAALAALLLVLLAAGNVCHAKEPRYQKAFKYTDPMVFEFGGNVTFTGTLIGDEKYFYLGLAPTFSSFIVKGFAIGGGPLLYFEYTSHPCECNQGTTIVEKPLGGGLQLSFLYALDLNHAIFPFVGLGQGFTFGEDLESDVNQNRFFVGPDLGIKVVFRENGILSVFFRYQFTSTGKEDVSDREERHDFIVGTGFGFWL